MASLYELATLHGTDKARSGLAAVYEPFVALMRDEPVRVLEIGVKEGASLRMWRDYFPKGEVVGIDIHEEASQHEGERIKIIVGDQTSAEVMARALDSIGPPDLVIDDGGHWPYQQIRSLLYLWPHVKPGRIYVVEDTHTSYMTQYSMNYRNPASMIEFLKGVVDDLHSHWHTHPAILDNVASVHFFDKTCLLIKQKDPVPRAMWPGIGKNS